MRKTKKPLYGVHTLILARRCGSFRTPPPKWLNLCNKLVKKNTALWRGSFRFLTANMINALQNYNNIFTSANIYTFFFVFFVIFSLGAFLLIYIRATRAGLLEAGGGARHLDGLPPARRRSSAGSCEGCSVQAWRGGAGWRSSTGRPARRGVPPRGASLRREPSNLNGCRRVQVCRASDVCKCAEPRTCAGKCAEMCASTFADVCRCARPRMCANVQSRRRVQT